MNSRKSPPSHKNKRLLHPRNRHQGRYDVDELSKSNPELAPYVVLNPNGDKTIDFSDPQAVFVLNKALLRYFYQIENWTLPSGYLCPPIPGRADYLHYLADLLADGVGLGRTVRVLDIGTGANLIYPILGSQLFGWQFVGSDVDSVSVTCAKEIVRSNKVLAGKIEVRQQKNRRRYFQDIIRSDEYFHLSMCNPPFHKSSTDAVRGTQRKLANLTKNKPTRAIKPNKAELNFGGQQTELVCQGGELAFIFGLIDESCRFKEQVGWFTSLVSKNAHIRPLKKRLVAQRAKQIKVVNMAQGQKVSRFIAWSFYATTEQTKMMSKKGNSK